MTVYLKITPKKNILTLLLIWKTCQGLIAWKILFLDMTIYTTGVVVEWKVLAFYTSE